jgi:multidrug efflux pump subunit AcrA (membrane-fusion protein)
MRRSLAFVAFAAGCGNGPAPTTDLDPSHATKPEVVASATAPVDYTAIVKARQSKSLTAAFAGRAQIRVRPSQAVHTGEVVASLDTSEIRHELDQARAEEAAARATASRASVEVAVAHRNVAVDRRLLQVGVSSRIYLDQAISEEAKASATETAQRKTADARSAAAAAIADKIEHADVTAPFDGVISLVHVKDGDSVAAGATLLRVVDPSHLVVEFAVPSADETPLAVDMKVELALPHHAPIAAVITSIADELEPPISFRIVEADLDPRALAHLRPSAIGRVTIAARP